MVNNQNPYGLRKRTKIATAVPDMDETFGLRKRTKIARAKPDQPILKGIQPPIPGTPTEPLPPINPPPEDTHPGSGEGIVSTTYTGGGATAPVETSDQTTDNNYDEWIHGTGHEGGGVAGTTSTTPVSGTDITIPTTPTAPTETGIANNYQTWLDLLNATQQATPMQGLDDAATARLLEMLKSGGYSKEQMEDMMAPVRAEAEEAAKQSKSDLANALYSRGLGQSSVFAQGFTDIEKQKINALAKSKAGFVQEGAKYVMDNVMKVKDLNEMARQFNNKENMTLLLAAVQDDQIREQLMAQINQFNQDMAANQQSTAWGTGLGILGTIAEFVLPMIFG